MFTLTQISAHSTIIIIKLRIILEQCGRTRKKKDLDIRICIYFFRTIILKFLNGAKRSSTKVITHFFIRLWNITQNGIKIFDEKSKYLAKYSILRASFLTATE